MSRVVVSNLSLNYPLYTAHRRSSAKDGAGKGDDAAMPDRMVSDSRNGVIGVKGLQDVSFTCESGERLAIIGANGSGKTTLLQVLAGIYAPDRGTVEIEGRATSIVNINLGVRAEASGHRNITLRGLAAGHTREEIEERRWEIAAFSELGDFLDLPVETYSSGMRMRLNFAIATAFDPNVLILDEWLSAGDSAFRMKATQRMKAFVEKAGILILASHSRRLLLDNCRRAIWLDGGRVRADGPMEEMLEAYEEEMARLQDSRDASMKSEMARRKAALEALPPPPPPASRWTRLWRRVRGLFKRG